MATIQEFQITNDVTRVWCSEKQSYFSRTLSVEELRPYINKPLHIHANLDIQQIGSSSQATIVTEVSIDSASGSEDIQIASILEPGDDHHPGSIFRFNPIKLSILSPLKITISCIKIFSSTTNQYKIRNGSFISVEVP